MFRELKTDPKLPHHYIISVGVKDALFGAENAGKFYLKYKPFYFTNQDVENLRDAIALTEDPLYKKQYELSDQQCYEVMGVEKLIELNSIFMASTINKCSVHHFSSENEIEEEWFEILVGSANFSKEARRLLDHARIGNYYKF